MGKRVMLLLAAAVLTCASCDDDPMESGANCTVVTNQTQEGAYVVDNATKELMLADFAKSLSSAISERRDVREFLKDKALEQFDMNYDVLYLAVKDDKISGASFEDIPQRINKAHCLSQSRSIFAKSKLTLKLSSK